MEKCVGADDCQIRRQIQVVPLFWTAICPNIFVAEFCVHRIVPRLCEIDSVGQTVASINALGYRSTSIYDAGRRGVASMDAKGNRSTTVYDTKGRAAVSARRTTGGELSGMGSSFKDLLWARLLAFLLADVVDLPAVLGVNFQPGIRQQITQIRRSIGKHITTGTRGHAQRHLTKHGIQPRPWFHTAMFRTRNQT